MKHILILGATGTFGTALVRRLQNTENHLTLFSRHAKSVYTDTSKITAVDGDALSLSDLKNVMTGIDVVYCAISGEMLPQVAKNLVSVMEESGVSRLLFMGAVGIYNEIPAEIDGADNLDNEPTQIPNREAVDIIEASNLNYTILRPGYLQEGTKEDYVLTLKGEPAKGYITTIPSLVEFAVSIIQDEKIFVKENVSITKDAEKERKVQ